MDYDENRIIDGRGAAKLIVSEVLKDVEVFSRDFRAPHLVVMVAGDDPASKVYVRSKVKTSEKCGIEIDLIKLPEDIEENEILNRLDELNNDSSIDGILVQLPLPLHIDPKKVIERISPYKDVDGFHPYNLGKIMEGDPLFVSCTPLGILELLKRYNVDTSGKNTVVIGRSVIVGKPIAMLLAGKSRGGNSTVTMCHSKTVDIGKITAKADIIVCAAGKAEIITGDMVKPGVVVIDVGINRIKDEKAKKGYRLVGDVDFESVIRKASLITPVPGGVGPMTVAMLMKNTLKAARLKYLKKVNSKLEN